ncbi:MAG: hypothetical protein IT458_20770 [Planctomycetes bacterium]|nr:hypothetical protein [Planctomycetota bacterium]
MRIEQALEQISAIHAQVLRSEVYRGYRARSAALTSLLVLAAAGIQAWWWPAAEPFEFAVWWVGVALLCAAVCAADLLGTAGVRREHGCRTATVLLQFAPAAAVGAALPWLLLRIGAEASAVLPGLWAAVFGLGVFASRPYLPRAVGWVALYYLLAGVVLLILARPGVPSPWSVGLTFGFGQAAAAVVLWFHLERGHDA